MQTVLITGGTGLIGKRLCKLLTEKGYKVILLTRKLKGKDLNTTDNISYAVWDVKKQIMDVPAIQKADHIIHLAGAGVVDHRWTASYKKEILESRTRSSELIIATMNKHSNNIKTVVCASAIGWYGPDIVGGSPFVETAPPDPSFLGETCRLWEESIEPVQQTGKRLVRLRTGIVLSNEGGAYAEFKKPLRFGIAGILGSGKQVISWIHIDDLCRLYIESIRNPLLSGTYNAVAPEPVNNKQLTLELAKQLRGKFFIPIHIPQFALKIVLGKRSIEVLKSATVSCALIKQTGFTFLFPSIESAIKELCSHR